jgi:hypothetical protein
MIKQARWLSILLLAVMRIDVPIRAEYNLLTLATVKARTLGMGEACTSVRDELAFLDQNPAAVEPGDDSGFRIALNPLGPWEAFHDRKTWSDWTVPVDLSVRALQYRYRSLVVGALFGEESLDDAVRVKRSDPFGMQGYQGHRNTSISAAVFLSPRVSLGAGLDELNRTDNPLKRSWGYRYGIALSPHPDLSIGIVFFGLPDHYDADRMPLERYADESLNIGISYRPWRTLLLALDVRNVSNADQAHAREPRAGIEITPFRHLVLRCGWAKDGDGGLASFGIGLFDWNAVLPESWRSSGGAFGLEAAMVIERIGHKTDRWIVASCLVRL